VIDLSSKSALITGAGRGIGKEIAMTLAKAGCDVAVSDIDLGMAESTAKEIESLGRKSLALKADVSKAQDVEVMIKNFI
jgi:NAD(P)-dependent dehydrogenase (short-subunit alcohol dehydrogenase family)